MSIKNIIESITAWIKNYAVENNLKTLVIGISGGVDSSVVSTLCALTGLPVYVITMPIKQIKSQHELSVKHSQWLIKKFNNVTHKIIDLDTVYNAFKFEMQTEFNNQHAFANSKSRLRMVALYQVAGATQGLVVGTGNKVEDFGVGFYTKYGDGGVDISPIADLMKSEVYEIARYLEIDKDIINAEPTDGLWEDGRTDKDQLRGLTYDQMEQAMVLNESELSVESDYDNKQSLLETYHAIRKPNLHKMNPIPVFKKTST